MKPTAIFILVTSFILLLSFASRGQQNNIFLDTRNNKTYATVLIGKQVWMAENLNYAIDTGSFCYLNLQKNCDAYGRLYTWKAASRACPEGWHLPAESEWQQLELFAGMESTEANKGGYRGASAACGTKLKASHGWKNADSAPVLRTGFNAIAGGCGSAIDSSFYLIETNALFWTATPFDDNYAYNRDLDYGDSMISRNHRDKRLAMSVRCLKNE